MITTTQEMTQERLPLTGVEPAATWRLDDHTREIGRRGLAEARAALAQAERRAAERQAALAGGAGQRHAA